MNDYQTYYNGGFSPEWIENSDEKMPDSTFTRNNKSLETLLSELEEIKGHLENVQARQWQLARLIEFNKNGLAKE